MFGSRKRVTKKIEKDEGNLSKYAVAVNGLIVLAGSHQNVVKNLEQLQNAF